MKTILAKDIIQNVIFDAQTQLKNKVDLKEIQESAIKRLNRLNNNSQYKVNWSYNETKKERGPLEEKIKNESRDIVNDDNEIVNLDNDYSEY